MSTEGAVKTYASAEEESKAFIWKVYGYMSAGLLITGLVSLWLLSRPDIILEHLYTITLRGGKLWWTPRPLLWVLSIGSLIFVWVVSARISKMRAATVAILLAIYSAVIGVIIAPTLFLYTKSSVASTFFISAVMFASFSAFGYITKRDLSGIGSICMMALWGIIIATVVNYFILHSTGMQLVVAYIGVVIFAGLTAHDTQKIKQLNVLGNAGTEEDTKEALHGALHLYLDFINIFLFLLRILGSRRN